MLFHMHQEWGRKFADVLRTSDPVFSNDRTPLRPLRVGYVSPDFRNHATARFFEPLLAAHRSGPVVAYCYATGGVDDQTTERLRRLAFAWRDISRLSDVLAATQIREDQIDILVDLSGHMNPSRYFCLLSSQLRCRSRISVIQIRRVWVPSTTGLPMMSQTRLGSQTHFTQSGYGACPDAPGAIDRRNSGRSEAMTCLHCERGL